MIMQWPDKGHERKSKIHKFLCPYRWNPQIFFSSSSYPFPFLTFPFLPSPFLTSPSLLSLPFPNPSLPALPCPALPSPTFSFLQLPTLPFSSLLFPSLPFSSLPFSSLPFSFPSLPFPSFFFLHFSSLPFTPLYFTFFKNDQHTGPFTQYKLKIHWFTSQSNGRDRGWSQRCVTILCCRALLFREGCSERYGNRGYNSFKRLSCKSLG